MSVYGTLFWVGRLSRGKWGIILGEWGWTGHYFGWVEVGGALFWVSGVVGGLSWVCGARWVGVGALFDNAPFKYSNWNIQLSLT